MGKKGDPKGIPNFPGSKYPFFPNESGTQPGTTGPAVDPPGTQLRRPGWLPEIPVAAPGLPGQIPKLQKKTSF
jgi:hypothetical protein